MKLGRIGAYASRQRARFAVIVALSLLISGSAALAPWPLKLLVDYGLIGAEPPDLLRAILRAVRLPQEPAVIVAVAALASLLVFGLNSATQYAISWNLTLAGQTIVRQVANDLFARLQAHSLTYHARHAVGDLLSRITVDSWCSFNIVQSVFVAPVQHIGTVAVVTAVAWRLDGRLCALMLLAAPLIGASAVYFGSKLRKASALSRESESRLTSFVHQTLGAIPAVKAFGTENANRRRFELLAMESVSRSQWTKVLRQVFTLTNGMSLTIGAALVMYVGGTRVISGELSVGNLLVFIAYMRTVQGASEALLTAYANVRSWQASWERVLDILDAREEVEDRAGAVELGLQRPGKSGALRLEGVTFGYEPDRPVLRDVELAIDRGETLALVGPTGAGKSTILSLILRFFDPWSGCVRLDGRDIRDIRLASLRQQISLVLQEPFLLPLTIAENIAYGRPDATAREVQAAAVAARADEFIRKLPQGYATPIGERGVTLSGGQRQRLAIARALLKDAPILLMDEPTSALDPETESLLLSAFQTLLRGRTQIIIAHRLSTIRAADRIAFLEDGRILELGSHNALMQRNGRYASFHQLQNAPS